MSNDNKKDETCQSDVFFAVYVIYCVTTEKYYVGVTSQKNVYTRIGQHKRGKRQFLDKEIQRIGWENNFDWWVVQENVPSNLISDCERRWIASFGCLYPNGYNITIGGIKHFKCSEETREKISKAHMGKPLSQETKTKISKAKLGRPGRKGSHLSSETKAKLSKVHRGKQIPRKLKCASIRFQQLALQFQYPKHAQKLASLKWVSQANVKGFLVLQKPKQNSVLKIKESTTAPRHVQKFQKPIQVKKTVSMANITLKSLVQKCPKHRKANRFHLKHVRKCPNPIKGYIKSQSCRKKSR